VSQPPRPKPTRRPFFGWWIVAGTVAMFGVQSATFGFTFGVYLLAVESEFGWSKFAISTAFALSQTVSGFLGPGQGWLIDRFGPRAVMRGGVVMFSIAFILLSQVDDLWTFYAVVLFMGAGSNLAGFLTLNTAVANWFLRKRARALGLASTGIGIGGALAPVATWALVTYGWRDTAFASGIIILATGLPLSALMRRRPEDHGLQPDGWTGPVGAEADSGGPPVPPTASAVSFTVGEAMRDRSFWLVSAGHGMALVSVFAVIVHLVPHLVENRGWSETSAQIMFAVVTTASLAGQIAGGVLGDKYSKTKISAACMLGHCAALMMFAFGGGALVAPAAALHGLAWGTRGPLMMAIRADYYGMRNFGTIMGYSIVLVMLGPLVGPSFAGAMSDRFGNYTAAFAILGVATGVSAVFFLLARKPPLPRRVLGARP
jgi:MFS family permease